jgi:hypothetical protein
MEEVFHRELIEEVPEWGTQALLQMQQKWSFFYTKKETCFPEGGGEQVFHL